MRQLVVVTRFGWAWAGVVPDEIWVAERAELLERVTAAALRKVTVPFEWVWLVAPERYEQVREIADRVYPPAVLVACDADSETIAPHASRFVVARVDSDDAYMPEALERLAAMSLEPQTLINWPNGWQLDWRRGWLGERGWALRTQGGFLAVTSEGRENIPTMLLTGGDHNTARAGRTVIHVEERSWLRVNHDRNLSTKRWPDLPVLGEAEHDTILARAGIAKP
jgi:hypothetical protein